MLVASEMCLQTVCLLASIPCGGGCGGEFLFVSFLFLEGSPRSLFI